ncbi:MarR family winged helix-turn-helix transcriptional regulator [Pseudaminobacter sp. NGMCC 1.201702]|uniref:MarR family winged helix-turn-helix transcriptional regulator n=1 Tax=Pseudaminobacter sp. NGMCC 1.201702 TaxID=3391825 RepID=UPI0039EF8B85
MSQVYDVALEPSGIKTTQRAILVCVRREGPLTVGALADALVLDPGGLAHTLKPLFRDGLLSTSVDPKDKRNRLIAIEPEGLARIEASDHLFDEAQKRFEDFFGAAEAAALRKALRIIIPDDFPRSFEGQAKHRAS